MSIRGASGSKPALQSGISGTGAPASTGASVGVGDVGLPNDFPIHSGDIDSFTKSSHLLDAEEAEGHLVAPIVLLGGEFERGRAIAFGSGSRRLVVKGSNFRTYGIAL